MQTKLIEVLPFYIGCECQINDRWGVKTYHEITPSALLSIEENGNQLLPILRPLESMTEDESQYICPAASEGKATIFVNAEMTIYLLKRGFDLFDLHSQVLCLYRDEKGGLY